MRFISCFIVHRCSPTYNDTSSREGTKSKLLQTAVDETVSLFQSIILCTTTYLKWQLCIIGLPTDSSNNFSNIRMRSLRKSKLLPKDRTSLDIKSRKQLNLLMVIHLIIFFIFKFLHVQCCI